MVKGAVPDSARRRRLPPAARRAMIVAAAADLLAEQGYLPLATDALARRAEVSKGLVYAYFPGQVDLLNALLAREFAALAESGMEAAAMAPDLEPAALDCALIYYRRVADAGPAAHLILRDPGMAGRIDPEARAFRDRIARRLARLGRRTLGLPAKEAVAALGMATAIPEEAGLLAFRGDLSRETGEELCRRLILGALDALRPGARGR